MEGSDETAAAAPVLDLEASPLQGQTASAVLDLQGNVVRGGDALPDAVLLFEMLSEVGTLSLTSFRRMTVSFPTRRYIVSRDETHVYVVQTKVACG